MLEIDGRGGGGQMLRTALSLASVTNRDVRIVNVRGTREPPGLRPQHLAGVRLAGELTEATIAGGEVGSDTVEFSPSRPPAGAAEVDIGTAGSITLLFDIVVTLGPGIDDPIEVTATGGTDVKWSPPMAYYDRVKCRLLRALGFHVSVAVDRYGFYPVGGGRARMRVTPTAPSSIELTERGDRRDVAVVSIASEHLADAAVADRQRDAAVERLVEAGLDATGTARYVDSESPGSSVTVVGAYTRTRLGATALGERGTPSEDVGEEAAEGFIETAEGPGIVDRHLADQLMLPLAFVGGRVVSPAVTDHIEANASVFEAFGVDLEIHDRGDDGAIVRVDRGLP